MKIEFPDNSKKEYKKETKSDRTIETKRLWPTDDGPAVATPDQEAPRPDQPKVADTLDAVWQDMQHTGAT